MLSAVKCADVHWSLFFQIVLTIDPRKSSWKYMCIFLMFHFKSFWFYMSYWSFTLSTWLFVFTSPLQWVCCNILHTLCCNHKSYNNTVDWDPVFGVCSCGRRWSLVFTTSLLQLVIMQHLVKVTVLHSFLTDQLSTLNRSRTRCSACLHAVCCFPSDILATTEYTIWGRSKSNINSQTIDHK